MKSFGTLFSTPSCPHRLIAATNRLIINLKSTIKSLNGFFKKDSKLQPVRDL